MQMKSNTVSCKGLCSAKCARPSHTQSGARLTEWKGEQNPTLQKR